MAIFVTGSTGYLGSYLVAGLLREHRDMLNLLVRAKSEQEARERLWKSLQLHFEFSEFSEYLNTRVRIFLGDLTNERFGLPDEGYHDLVVSTKSIFHRPVFLFCVRGWLANISRIDGCAGCRRRNKPAELLAVVWRPIFRHGELGLAARRLDRVWRFAA